MKTFHHIGIPTQVKHDNEIYYEFFKVYGSDITASEYGIEWVRFEPDSPAPELLKTVPHLAFTVDDLEAEVQGKEILVPISGSDNGMRSAFIVSDGAPVELLQFSES